MDYRTSAAKAIRAAGGRTERLQDELAAAFGRDAGIGAAVLAETAKLHAGDAENLAALAGVPAGLPRPKSSGSISGCDVSFDHTLGESFYDDQLAPLVEELLARASPGKAKGRSACSCAGHEDADDRAQAGRGLSLCHHRPGHDPLPHGTLAARRHSLRGRSSPERCTSSSSSPRPGCWATTKRRTEHVSFGTVLGDDGRPFKTRAGDTVGLEGLLDEAVPRAAEIVAANDDAKPDGPELSPDAAAANGRDAWASPP